MFIITINMTKKTSLTKDIKLWRVSTRMQSTQVGDNNISQEKIYNKLVEDENGFMQDILKVNESRNDVINTGYIYLYEDSVKSNYIEGDAKSWDKVTKERLKNLSAFLYNLYEKKELVIYPYMLIIH